MLIGFPVMATNMILSNAYIHQRRHDGFVLKWAFFAAFGNLLTVAAAYFLMQPNAAAFGVLASEGAAFVFLVFALLKGGVQIEGDNASKAKEHAALLQPSSDTSALMAKIRG
jgi:hypothetical protein